MIFRRSSSAAPEQPEPGGGQPLFLAVCGASDRTTAGSGPPNGLPEGWVYQAVDSTELPAALPAGTAAVAAYFQEPAVLTCLLQKIAPLRSARTDGFPVLVAAVRLDQLAEFGAWLHQSAQADALAGLRIIAAESFSDAAAQLHDKMSPIPEPSFLKMPATTEVETPVYRYVYTISPQLRRVTSLMKQFAQNSVTRIYLLGAPGAGKTTLAYYYWLCRGKGRFVAVNLTAESTDDKAAMKSLLCGHVAGALGPHSREGALSFAEDGVCFLDESHGVTGVVMQVLMEVLDSGQYLQFGATKKRSLECAVIFASNRSWDVLRRQMHLDEYARLGTTIIHLADLRHRPEDLIAVLAATLARFASGCTTWTPPHGITPAAWKRILQCPWRGNVRTLIRVAEAAGIALGSEGSGESLIDERHMHEALALWEPEEHPGLEIYPSYT